MKTLLAIDGSFSYQKILDKELLHTLSIRHLNGFWDRVWSVHPIDNYLDSAETNRAFCRPEIVEVSPVNIFHYGRFGLTKWLRKIGPLNFLVGQIYLIFFCRLVKCEKNLAVRTGDLLLCELIDLGVKLGPGTVVAAGAVVTRSFESGSVVIGGVPAKIIRKY